MGLAVINIKSLEYCDERASFFGAKISNGGNMGKVQAINELIDNERFLKESNSMTMSMKRVYGVREAQLDENEVDERADSLVAIFDAGSSKPLYCDAVRYLTRAYLNEKVEYALHKGKNPAALFGAIIYRQLCRAGIYPKCSV